MPSEQVQYYYEQAKEHGGIFKIEYEGGINPEFWSEDMPEPEDVADGPGFHGFLQKRGHEHIKSVIYVKIVECDGQEEILMVNTQLTPVDATVNTRGSNDMDHCDHGSAFTGIASLIIQTDFQVTDPDQ